jgi:PAS domain S-box-containing protein
MNSTMLRILLLEDNPADANLLHEILHETTDENWNIVHVEKLRAALEVIPQHSFDIVLSDLSLPDAQGLDTVVQIHALTPALPIVVLTGLNNEEIGLQALRQGAQDYLVKGQIQSELLVRTIRYAIERSHTQQIMQRQAAAMAASMEGIAILNAQREYIYANWAFAQLYGYDHPDELMGMTLNILYKEGGNDLLWQLVEPSTQQQGYWRGEVMARRRNQEMFYQELSITALRDGGFVCNVRDITEQKIAEVETLQALEREKELNELKSKFVSIVSHEFRTPLTTILSSVELLQKYGDQVSAEKNQRRFSRIIKGIHRMTQLLNDVLIFNKVEVGSLTFKPVLSNPVEFFDELVEEIQLQVGNSHHIKFVHQTCNKVTFSREERNHYFLDEQLLQHVLTNLVSNSVKYSPKNTDISIKLFCEFSQIIFHVVDQGIGIPSTDLERLFIIFQRGTNVGTIPGAGLGLAIVKQCVDLHNGTIEVNSKIHQGTEFKVTIPTHAT